MCACLFTVVFTACGELSNEEVKKLIVTRLTYEWPGFEAESIENIRFGKKQADAWVVKARIKYTIPSRGASRGGKYNKILQFTIHEGALGKKYAIWRGYD